MKPKRCLSHQRAMANLWKRVSGVEGGSLEPVRSAIALAEGMDGNSLHSHLYGVFMVN